MATNVALVAPDGTVTEAGTLMALLLLATLTTRPVLGAAAVNLTVQLSVPAPIMEVLEQLNDEREAVPEVDPFPCSLTVLDEVVCTLERLSVVKLRVPVVSPVVLASY